MPPVRSLLVAPAFVLLGLVFVYPIGQALYLSLFTQNLTTTLLPVFNGGANYIRLINDGRFGQSLVNTLIFSGISVPLELLLGLGFALILNQEVRGRGLLRTIVILPWALPTALIALAWSWIFNAQYGLANDLLLRLGILTTEINWLGDPTWAMTVLILAEVWKTTPFVALLLLAGLQTIPRDLYNAHALDGATAGQSFWRITLPLLWPQILLVLVLRFAQALGVFDLIQVMTGGGPAGMTESVGMYLYTTVMRYLDFGYGSALLVVTFVLLVVLIIGAVYLLPRNSPS